ncbi:hypothetical protein EDC17_104118 [Sphingobacterium alimentarium]|uniref:Uncharacterized protein n=1 Tax=Sphingobacterium alimentarium TaxID=797292 RepID=A0A4R3VV86_9SPHI|nr:hypothetical protein EDC17_104118 [Sphingobacterium alimentarium]
MENLINLKTEMTKRELTAAKSQLTREIKTYINEIEWITRDDNNGKPISTLYHGKPREPQLTIRYAPYCFVNA